MESPYIEPKPSIGNDLSSNLNLYSFGNPSAAQISPLLRLSRDELLDRLHHRNLSLGPISPTSPEALFVEKWSKTLPPQHWEKFLVSWYRAFSFYNTPFNILERVTFTPIKDIVDGKEYLFVKCNFGNVQLRRELLANQPHYTPSQSLASYGLRLHVTGGADSCGLCENVVQAIDTSGSAPAINNTMLDLGEFYLLPNRYPHSPGASLFLSKNHDDLSFRNILKAALPTPPGATRGNIISTEALQSVMQLSDTLDLVALRNHAWDGMSIPHHDHYQLFPADLPSVSFVKATVDSYDKGNLKEEILLPANTPFDTIIITALTTERLAIIAQPVLEKLERADVNFCLGYYNRHLFISPRDNNGALAFPGVGASVPFHHVRDEDPAFIAKLVKNVPLRGTFAWDKFL